MPKSSHDSQVLGSLRSEALEVAAHNRWLAYGPPLHLARSFGLRNKLFDLLDEVTLIPSQVKQLCELLLDCPSLPQPEADYAAFETRLREALALVGPTFDALGAREAPWVCLPELSRQLGHASGREGAGPAARFVDN